MGVLSDIPAASLEGKQVLVVDDSAVARLVVQRVINETDRLSVAGHASSAEEAMNLLASLSVDLVVLDIEMPGMDGIEAIPHILRATDNAPVLIVSSHCRAGGEAAMRAMAMGASDLIAKPQSRAENENFGLALATKMLRLAEAPAVSRAGSASISAEPRRTVERPVRCLALGASTGGIHALTTFLTHLPDEMTMPILITQHLPADFMVYFAEQLRLICGRDARPARDGEPVMPGRVLVAPGHAHLALEGEGGRAWVRYEKAARPGGFCPSVDPMLETMGEVFGADSVGVVLTGMGSDGAAGAASLAAAGGEVLVQDKQSSVIWGMPGAVASRGLADLAAPPADLARHVGARGRAFGWK